MRVLVDENIPSVTVNALRDAGHEVRDLRGTPDEGASDEGVRQLAQSEERLLITTDKGFAARRGEPHFGILVIRLWQPNRLLIHERVMQGIALALPDEWPGLLVIMRDSSRSTWRRTPSEGG